jgi:hypothetical protein
MLLIFTLHLHACYLYISTSACLMNGVCHAEGTNWTSGCVEYTCMLTSAGYRSVEINQGMYYIKVSELYIN